MKISKEKWNIKDENFGPLLPYIQDDNITDIDYNGQDVWVEHLIKGPYKTETKLDPKFVTGFAIRISDVVSRNFNKNNNVLEAETDTLRISIVHNEVTATGYSISIRKTPPIQRITVKSIIEDKYCSQEVLNLLVNSITAHMNIVFCGLPGSGKTELLKFLTQFIPDYEKAITIEDNLEIHYRDINPDKNCVEMKVDAELFDYTKAIKTSLRQNPKRLLLSEARSEEVKYLLEGFSTGISGLTTLHTDDTRKIPERIQNMMHDTFAAERLENDIYTFINMGILIRKITTWDCKIYRYIDQICIFDSVNGVKTKKLLVNEGKIVNKELTENIFNKFKLYGIQNPFEIPEVLMEKEDVERS